MNWFDKIVILIKSYWISALVSVAAVSIAFLFMWFIIVALNEINQLEKRTEEDALRLVLEEPWYGPKE